MSDAAFAGDPGTAGFDPRRFGARGDGLAKDTAAIQAAIGAAGRAGGGRVILAAGTWLTGALLLAEGVELVLGPGAVLLGSGEPGDFPLVEDRWEGQTRLVHAPLVGGRGLRYAAIRGPGVIDGGGAPWWESWRKGSLAAPRPRLVAFSDCARLRLEDFAARNSPSWTVNPVRCGDVLVRGLTILNPADSPNTDGINPDSCADVRISDCLIDVGDDCIAIKSGVEAEEPGLRSPCERIAISDCVFRSGHGGVVIGSEMSGSVRDVVVSNCVFSGTDRGIRIKTRRGRGGSVEGLRAQNVAMRDVLVPLAVNMHYGCGAWGDPVVGDPGFRPRGPGTPRISSIEVRGLSATGVRLAAGFVDGLAESPVEGLSIADWDVRLAPEGGEPAQAEMGDGLPAMRGAGFFARRVRGLRMRGVEIRGQKGPAFDLAECEDVSRD